jgi:uncharacterized membrane protein YdbT with pleckstrin-like domain
MSYVASVLQPGENVRYATNIHWIKYWPGAGLLVAAGAAYWMAIRPEASSVIWDGIAIVVGACAGVMLFAAWFKRWTTEIAVTDRRIIKKTGFISRDTMEMSLDKVESVQVDQSILGRILNYGDITLQGTGGGKEQLFTIASALQFRSHVTAE